MTSILAALEKFQEGFTQHDPANLPEFMRLFSTRFPAEVIGTNGIHRGEGEWYADLKGIQNLIKEDWEGWGDVVLDIRDAQVQEYGEVAWMTVGATVSKTLDGKAVLSGHLKAIREVLDREGLTAEARLLEVMRGTSNTIFEVQKGDTYTWPLRISAVLVREGEDWKFCQIHFSFPTTRFPDIRID